MGKTDELVKAISPKQKLKKKGNDMKKNIIIAVVSVTLTLLVVATFAYTYQAGVKSERNRTGVIEAKATELVNKVTPSK